MISINQVSVNFGAFYLFREISFLINQKDRIGLVGKNGAGKSTLLKIILGIEQPSQGTIARPKDLTYGYLPQQMSFTEGNTVLEETLSAFNVLNKIETEINSLSDEIAHRIDYESAEYHSLIDKLTEYNERLRILGISDKEAITEQTLKGLGFLPADFNRQTTEFSGGWRMRIELAKILLQKPDVLLLDEPTNHLDIESIQWLEDFLKDYFGSVIMVSHDKTFLDNITKRTIEISLGKIYDYKVPYSKYVELRQERYEQQLASFENQQKKIADTEKFIERFRYKATKAVQVQSRIKQLEKIERIEIDEQDATAIHFRFPPAPRSGQVVIETIGLSKSYGNKNILDKIDFILERGEKVSFIGRNGEGKTTLSKILVGGLEYEGILKTGHNVNIGYFAQNQDQLLDENLTVFETLDIVAVGEVRTKIRNILGSFLFSGETVEKKVKVLSGGERSRLALAKLLLEPYNLLVLDEPTNHLDIKSKEILKRALKMFDGTLVVVSHDRDFLDGLVDKLYEFKDRKIKEHSGDIYEFLKKKKIENLKEVERKTYQKPENQEIEISQNKQEYLERKEFEKIKRKLVNQVKESEGKIEKIEAKIIEIELKLAGGSHFDDQSLYQAYEQLKTDLEKEMLNWEKLHDELEKLEKI
ncbi:MAG: ABC-F family ATP-binding cassette domain-containing protein [Bacteroidales bacterium]